MRLVKIEESDKPGKKLSQPSYKTAAGQKKFILGIRLMQDYTQHHDAERRERYRARHQKDLKTDQTRAGYLSFYVLWGRIHL
jgi:hypothetical protein